MAITGFNNDINTLERAVRERVFYVKKDGEFATPPTPEPEHFERSMLTTLERLKRFLPKTAPMTRADFVSTFRGRKLKIYTAAAADLLRSGLVAADANVKVFVKYEKVDFTRKTDPVPRVISPRSPRYNVELGRFLRALEERIFHSLAKLFGHTTVFKGMNSLRSGRVMYAKWCMFRHPVALGLDASRFDQHVSVSALKWEHGVYSSCFPQTRHRRRLNWLLRMQLRNKCVGYTVDGRLKYRTEGGRMSGDMNTSLGNCVLMCCMIFAYAAHVGVKMQLANNGDDCVVIMEACDLDRFSLGLDAWFTAMGFSMVAEAPCYQFEGIEFCQTHPVWVGPNHDDYLMVRHPKWAVAKDTMCVHGYQTPALFRGWMHAVGTGGMAMAGQIPVLQDFYAAYLRSGQHHKASDDAQSWGVRQLSKGMVRGYGVIPAATRASFYWAFGVTPDEQVVLEEFYGGVVIGSELLTTVEYQLPMPL
jgi:hypothetical protein